MNEAVTEHDPFVTLSSQTAYQNGWIKVEHQEVLRPDGSPGIYGIVHFVHRAVGVLPIDKDGCVWLVGQYRRPLKAWSWEMPEGGVTYEEDLEAGARRELHEETGLIAQTLVKILEMDLSNSVSDEVATCYIAYGLSKGQAVPECTEVLKTKRVHFLDLLAEVALGQIRDAMTVATIYRAYYLATTHQLPSELESKMLSHALLGRSDFNPDRIGEE
ncbi:NUDIX domain-containing protein [Candidatus Phycosocius spiralis]|uniref:GDP-mannose pyrophosphatase n=1 Tax=Candidatus Phycosocius spiralis TaxID=2815099 RepID=A0ABQ4PWH4_9PROT|nr:NUDIX hydrolase [Candidatus Phycosocius spiralis]GIU67412.1 DNA mismatch repair protein MutT [Candidatus Phycosocius spiralis]